MPSSSRSRGSINGPHGPLWAPLIAPMSERQQLAMVMQLTSQGIPPEPAPTPPQETKKKKKNRNERGETPLHVAAIKGDHNQVKKLLKQGQDPDAADFAGWTALHEACSYGWYQVVVVLVEGGANVNAKGLDDDTPLHDATTSGNLEMVQYLVDHGAEPWVKNAKGKIPLDYAAADIHTYLQSLKESKTTHNSRARDDSRQKGGNASSSSDSKRNSMDVARDPDGKDTPSSLANNSESKDESHNQLSSGVVSSSQDDTSTSTKRPYNYDDMTDNEAAEDDVARRKKRKDEEKELMAKPAPVVRSNTGRILTGTKMPGPASKTGVASLGKSGLGPNANKATTNSVSSKGATPTSQKGGGSGKVTQSGHQGKSSNSNKSVSSTQSSKSDRKSPVASPKPSQKETEPDESDKSVEAPKVPPLKIVIPGGSQSSRTEQEEGGAGQRGQGKGRGSISTLPYVIPCTNNENGHASDSSDGTDEKRTIEGKLAQRVLRSHRINDGEKGEKGDKERTSPQTGGDYKSTSQQNAALGANKSPTPVSNQDNDHQMSTVSSSSNGRNESSAPPPPVELHPRKRKIKSSRESHSREPLKGNIDNLQDHVAFTGHSNPYQMYLHIRKQIDCRQKILFPVKPKPPKDFNKYLMNRRTYNLLSTLNAEPTIEMPINLALQMKDEFIAQEKDRHRLRIQHLIEKEKLVLAVEQEILRVHGRAERAVANQSLPFSVCTMLRDDEVYTLIAPEQEEKRNAQRSRCNGRQINSWLQEVDDKWEKLKEGMLRRQHTEAESLYQVQTMTWEWKLKELGLCDHKANPKIEPTHVPHVHVSNFDLPA